MSISNETLGAAIGILGNGSGSPDIEDIKSKIPNEASSSNQLADKDYVNESISSSSAYYRGLFPTKYALLAAHWQTSNKSSPYYVTNNDYAIVEADESHNGETWRYSYVYEINGENNGWHDQYRVNEKDVAIKYEAQSLSDSQKTQSRDNISAEKKVETMTMSQYEALTSAQKMDGTVRFITDVNSYPDAGGVGF